MKQLFSVAVSALLLFSSLGVAANRSDNRTRTETVPVSGYDPLVVGEKLTYEVSWADFLVAGELVLEVKKRMDAEAGDTVQVSAEAQSVGLVNLAVLKVKDVYISEIGRTDLRPLRAEKRSRHGKKNRQSSITFDWTTNKATLSSGREVDLKPGTCDIAGLLWAIRGMDLTTGRKRNFRVIEDEKIYELTVEPEGREKVTTPAGTFDAVRLGTRMSTTSRDSTIYNLRIYITSDSRRMPVLITAEPAWGKVKVSLTSATGTRPAARK
jgi:hypothetical protein